MSNNVVKIELLQVISVDNYDIKAEVGIGDIKWRLTSGKNEAGECIIVPDKYYRGLEDKERAIKLLNSVGTEVDEHCHDEHLLNLLKEAKEKYTEEERVKAIKWCQERKELTQKILKNAKAIFSGLTVTMTDDNPEHIYISDGVSTVSIARDWNPTKKWFIDTRQYGYYSGPGHRSYVIHGEKKASLDLAKLEDVVRRELKYRADVINNNKKTLDNTQLTDAEMLKLGWTPAGQEVYKDSKFVKTSNSGTIYNKDNITVTIKRIEGVLSVVSYVKNLSKNPVSIETFNG